MEEHHDLYASLGLPTLTANESSDIKNNFENLAKPDHHNGTSISSFGANPKSSFGPPAGIVPLNLSVTSSIDPTKSYGASSTPAYKAGSVYYVNFTINNVPDWARIMFSTLQADVTLSQSFWSIKSQRWLDQRINSGEIGSYDRSKQADYKAKLTDAFIQRSSWVATNGIHKVEKRFKCAPAAFHCDLVKQFGNGLGLPEDIVTSLEDFLQNVASSLRLGSPTESTTKFVVLTVYTLDEMMRTVRADIRTIYFSAEESLRTWAGSKHSSGGAEVNIHFTYLNSDGLFNQDLFSAVARPEILLYTGGQTKHFIGDDVNDIPVDA